MSICSVRYAADWVKPALCRAKLIDYQSRPANYAYSSDDEMAKERPCRSRVESLVKSAGRIQSSTNMLSCIRRAMCVAKCIHSHERRHSSFL